MLIFVSGLINWFLYFMDSLCYINSHYYCELHWYTEGEHSLAKRKHGAVQDV